MDIRRILDEERIVMHAQPICSVKLRGLIGLEVLARGLDEQGGLLLPEPMFAEAAAKRLALELDRLCRKKGLDYFTGVLSTRPDAILFLNLDTSILGQAVVGSGYLMKAVRRLGLEPQQIVVEIIESRANDLDALWQFVETYRAQGFIIGLDDVGVGYSNLDRIPLLKPDVLKIDRGLIRGIAHEYHKQEAFKSLVGLAHATGALVVAEGVEAEDEASWALELGADLLQGYYLAHAGLDFEAGATRAERCVRSLMTRFEAHMLRKIQARTEQERQYRVVLDDVLGLLMQTGSEGVDAVLRELVCAHPGIEYLYVLDGTGIQVSDTAGHPSGPTKSRHFVFQPARRGTDHGMKAYVLALRAGSELSITEPYISLATGTLCRTLSAWFLDLEQTRRIVCIDFRA
jgi:EAL domain-containing protein (putative c-di-GMP-specific phosphodiesterase class I)